MIREPANGARQSGWRARRAELVVLFAAIATLGLISALLVFTTGRG